MIDPDTSRTITDPVSVAYGIAAISAVVAGVFWFRHVGRAKGTSRQLLAETATGVALFIGGAGYLFDILT